MKFGRLTLSALAASTLVAAPVVAQAAAVADRDSAEFTGEQLRGGLGIPIAVLIALAVALIIISDSDEDPSSP